MSRETGFFREQWIFFKKGKNEVSFLMGVYNTLILLFGMSYIGDLPVSTLVIFTGFFVLFFVLLANRIGKYTAKKVDTSGFYVSPFFVDQTLYRLNLIRGLNAQFGDDEILALTFFNEAEKILMRWMPKDGKRI